MKKIKTLKLVSCDFDKELSEEKSVSFFLEPNYIYYPLKDFELIKNKNDYVFEGEAILKNIKYAYNIYSSVSGNIESIDEEMYSKNGKLEKFVKIKNDFKKNKIFEKKINIINNKEDLINLCFEKGIVGLGGAEFPTFIKLKNDNIRDLIVNACECEPFLTCDYKLIIEKAKCIIEVLNLIRVIMNYDNIFIAIKKTKNKAIKLLEKEIISRNLNEFIKIKTVVDAFPVGYEKYLVKKILNKEYKNYPYEASTIILNVSTVYAIYEAIMFNKPLTERLVTISGYSVKTPKNVYIKIGSCFKELIEELNSYIDYDSAKYLFSNGPMTGNFIKTENLIFTPGLSGVSVFNERGHQEEEPCMGCGKCNEYCPSNLNPSLIKNSFNNIDLLSKLAVHKCISCNLCSYVCPSRINLSYFVFKSKEKVLRGKKNEK